MTEQTAAAAPAAQLEQTKHSNTIRSRDGRVVALTRSNGLPLHALTIQATADPNGAKLTVWITDDDLRALTAPAGGPARCENCRFSRLDARTDTRCHRNGPRKRADETFFPRMTASSWCGHWKPALPMPAVPGAE